MNGINEFDDETPQDFSDVEAMLRDAAEPDVPENLLPALLNDIEPESTPPSCRTAVPLNQKTRWRLIQATVAASLVLTIVFWTSLQWEDTTRTADSESPAGEVVTSHFPHETDPCFILPQ